MIVENVKNDYFTDINTIHNFKNVLPVENYNDLVDDLVHDHLSKLYIDKTYKEAVSVDILPREQGLFDHYHFIQINPAVVPNLVEQSTVHHLPLYFADFRHETMSFLQNNLNDFLSFISVALPLFFIGSLALNILRMFLFNINNKGNGLNNNPFSSNNPFLPFPQKNFEAQPILNMTLDNWAGSPEIIEECKEIISFIDQKELYKKIGADMPKGILLEGPPGTGKTLLAKTIASVSNSSFFSASASEFVEMFVGMGASRVRTLFETARENKPSIIFIDEIDAIGKKRGVGFNGGNDEREQTLNQLLYEMDGFNDNDDLIVMAATNRRDVLDPALLRPGRFDRILRVPLPDKSSREKILEFYLKEKMPDADIEPIAELTDGFSGAQLKNLVNEAAILSVKNNHTTIQENFLFEAFEKLLVGIVKKNANTPEATSTRVSIHETGHALLSLIYPELFDFQKVSIQPTYNGAGGYTIFSEKPEIREGGLYTKEALKKRLIVTLGGKAAESLYYGDENVSLGAIEDLRQANKLAQQMIGNFGMGDKLQVFFNEEIGETANGFGNKYSENTKKMIDRETLQLVTEAYQEAKDLLKKYYERMISFSKLLSEKKVLYKKDLDGLDFSSF
jgi:cell division protease FtsH